MLEEKSISHFLHDRLKSMRLVAGLTQNQVANVLGIDRSTYTYYERGRSQPNLDILSKLCAIFNVDFNELLGFEETPAHVADSSNDLNSESDISPIDNEHFNTLSPDEKDLILRFRLLSSSQKKEFLISFGIIEDTDSSDEIRK